jgi:hypothetical protein
MPNILMDVAFALSDPIKGVLHYSPYFALQRFATAVQTDTWPSFL